MNSYILAGSAQDVPNYDCRPFNFSEEYIKKRGSPNLVLGIGFISYGVIAETFYILALFIMLTSRLRHLSCYRIMIVLGMYDMCAIAVNSLLTGYLWLIGGWYCVYPDLIYITGSLGLGFWCGACMNCFVLVVNRLVDLWKPQLMLKIFSGYRTFLILLLPFIYTIYFIMFTPTLMFNSEMSAWFFDPFITGQTEEKIYNYPHTANNLLIVVTTCVLYTLVVVVLLKKFPVGTAGRGVGRLRIMNSQYASFCETVKLAYFFLANNNTIDNLLTMAMTCVHYTVLLKKFPVGTAGRGVGRLRIMNSQYAIIIQATVICLVNLVAALIYVYMQFFPTSHWLILLGHFSWQAGHGMPAFIYILVNKTIQGELRKKLYPKKLIESMSVVAYLRTENRVRYIACRRGNVS